MPKKRKMHGEEHGNSERWLLTYADMITLLTAFFIMMYSMSVLNMEKFNKVAISIRSGFGGNLEGGGDSILNPSLGNSIRPTMLPEMDPFLPSVVAQQVKGYAKKKNLQEELRITQTERGLVVSILTDRMLFPKGEATLTPDAAQLLSKVSSLISGTSSYVRIEGHTDDLPIRTARFPSNWELSTTRATTVVRYLIEVVGFNPNRLSAAGYADSRPLYPNNSEKHRSMNRRVDIVIMPASPPAPAGQAGKVPTPGRAATASGKAVVGPKPEQAAASRAGKALVVVETPPDRHETTGKGPQDTSL